MDNIPAGVYSWDLDVPADIDCPEGHVCDSDCQDKKDCPCVNDHDHELMLLEMKQDMEANNGENEFEGR